MIIYVKNMVCDRCNIVVGNILQELNIIPRSITLGEVDLGNKILTTEQLKLLKSELEKFGFELLTNKTTQLIEKIKKLCIKFVEIRNDLEQVKLSDYLSKNLPYEYNYLSQLFSSVEGITIEYYYIKQRIEKAKELLVYNQISLTEIAYQLSYSSVAHLSGQFKKITGLTPSHFRSLKDTRKRQSRDKV
ncbi:MAG: helix-turn-helix transcriptional regulator [Emcibacteraceae bacterium]|nr:helix-turn-helix transcriptional regulator [Emcibacteraceae bacterium]